MSSSITNRKFGKRIWSVAAVAAVAAVAMVAVAAAPASAYVVDRPKTTDTGIDFGTNWDTFGAPLNGGYLYWNVNAAGVVTPHLTGNLYLKNSSGVRARMRIDYYDAAHNLLATRYGGSVYATSDALHTWSVDLEPFGATDVYHVHVSTTKETGPGSGVYQIVGTAVEDI